MASDNSLHVVTSAAIGSFIAILVVVFSQFHAAMCFILALELAVSDDMVQVTPPAVLVEYEL